METKPLDVVYFVKDMWINEELRYSLRSVSENLRCGRVWFYGGCPGGLRPDIHVEVRQTGATKWDRVNNMIRQACQNDEITEDFYLFNDDFFIMQSMEVIEPFYNGDLRTRVARIEKKHKGPSAYSKALKRTTRVLEKDGFGILNYALHIPLPVNRKKALETLDRFVGCPMFRSLYGNMWSIGGIDRADVKCSAVGNPFNEEADFLSTADDSFARGLVGSFIRNRFPEKSRFEY